MTKDQLKDIFKNSYDTTVWQQVLQDVFGAKSLYIEPKTLIGDNNENVEGQQLGWLEDENKYRIGLFEYEIKAKHNIKLNRVGLRNLVKDFIKFEYDAVLTVFYSQDGLWRLSFICDLQNQAAQPKRYSYVFGDASETYRTPSSRLSALIGTKPTFDTIKDAFSVESLNKEFITEYKKQYSAFLEETKGDTKENRDYVKKMLGRLVFIQFLQKKGWMGVPADSTEWRGGDPNYLQNLISKNKDNDRLLSEVLEPLFFDTLNTKRDDDIADKILGNNVRIPYLNGGIFDRDSIDNKDIDFSYKRFDELMHFFSSYNFTIDENDPFDAEIGVDPEMLGNIFENLLEDNKDKGAFYTPKEIVKYMCQQSLIEYLKSHTDECQHADIENLITLGEVSTTLQAPDTARDIDELLRVVKICDPAIGSGAFPMGILSEIFHVRQLIFGFTGRESFSLADTKREIIQNSIYGVDIEKGAVDIARLRFWLSLVVDEKEPTPLPNLDYKIMCGNSLLSRFTLDMSINDVFAEYNNSKNTVTNKLYENAFEWRFEFPALLDDDGRFIGFDIVIGNPPYVQLQANGGFLAEQLKGVAYETFARTGDIYCLFYERGIQLLCEGGIETYITSNKWMRAGYGEKIRTYFAQNNPLKLLDLGAGVFDSATVDTNILILQKGENKNQLQAVVSNKKDFTNIPFAPMAISNGDIWTVLSPIEQSIKSKIEAIGTPLKDWDIEIYRGVLTGYNEAFIIDTAKRDELVALDPTSAEIIKPILRGRDIKRYSANWAGLWLINTHNGVKSKNINPVDINNYPAVKAHLDTYSEPLNKRQDKGITPYNLRNCAYLEEFEKDKIVFQELTQGSSFCYDINSEYYISNTGYIITGKDLPYLYVMLNSKFIEYCFRQYYSISLGQKGLRWLSQYIVNLPIPQLTKLVQQPFIELVDRILDLKRENPQADTSTFEAEIDQMVYKLYNLTEEEIALIENR